MNVLSKEEKKEIKREAIKYVAGFLGGGCASLYAAKIMLCICPPAGVITGIGFGLIASVIDSKISDEVETRIDALYKGIDETKELKRKLNERFETLCSEEDENDEEKIVPIETEPTDE